MTPREKNIESASFSLSQWLVPFIQSESRKHEFTAMVHRERMLEGFQRIAEDLIAQAIELDRQSLQAETIKRLQAEKVDAPPPGWLALNGAIGIIQAVFASAESDRRVLAEREACAALCDYWAHGGEPGHGTAKRIKADILRRSNPSPASEAGAIDPTKPHGFDAWHKYSCKHCGLADDADVHYFHAAKSIDAPDRIALLTQIIGEQQIKIAQLEKERNEKKNTDSPELRPWLYHETTCICDACALARATTESPNNRKA